jgi:hypothetical protein
MAASCAACGGPLPPPGRGRPRTKCLRCAPPRRSRAPSPAPAAEPAHGSAGGIVGAVRRELGAAGRLDTSLGLAAVALAERIADGEDRGSALAALVKQLGATMADALRNAAVEGDEVDELRERRARRAAADA